MVISEARRDQLLRIWSIIWREPFRDRTWKELLFFCLGIPLLGISLAFVVGTLFVGALLAVTLVGVLIIALAVRGARGLGAFHRALARNLLGEEIQAPPPFSARPGFFGWVRAALGDRAGWRAIAYLFAKAPLTALGTYFALALWIDAFVCITFPVWGRAGGNPAVIGGPHNLFGLGYISVGSAGFFHSLFIFFTGAIFALAAPWPTRLLVHIDRRLMELFLGPDPVTARVRALEQARAQTVDSSAATLRRIERDLHDGTQAQLVALAMRLGQAKEELALVEGVELDHARHLIDEAHRGAKDAIVELRDLVRGIHPPALDIGLEGALSTLAARSAVPSELNVAILDRPTPAIEAIAYFCVAELLANVAQHARASKATITCAQHGAWLRVVVRDDGIGGACLRPVGSSSSGLTGLTERVHSVDGHIHIASPPSGPTAVTIDLPLHA
jgi:signal transduction histidine kinase